MDLSNLLSLTPARHADRRRGPPAPRAGAGCRDAAADPQQHSSVWQGDPTIAALLKLVAAPPAEVDAADRQPLDGLPVRWTADEVDELTDRLDASVRDVKRLGAQLERAERELRRLRDRNRRLAGALGACDSCWGEEPDCADCQGRGRPGRALPDDGLFAEIVMPVVRLARLGDPRSSEPGSEPTPACTPQEPAVVNLYASVLRDRGARQR